MELVEEEIKRWSTTHPKSPFHIGKLDKEAKTLQFSINSTIPCILAFNDQTLKPQHLTCENEDLISWALVLNFHLEDNPQRGVTDFLTRAEGALDASFKKQDKEEREAKPDEAVPQGTVEKEEGNENHTIETSRCEKEDKMDTEETGEKEDDEKDDEIDEFDLSDDDDFDFGTSMEDEGKRNQEKGEGAKDKIEHIKSEVAAWKKNNPSVTFNLFATHEDRHQIEATIGPDYYPFQVNFSEEWHPVIVTTDSSELQEYVTKINVQLEEKESKAEKPMKLEDVLDTLAASFNSALVVDSSATQKKYQSLNRYGQLPSRLRRALEQKEEEPAQADPTPLDWEEVIIPELRRFLSSENRAFYEIEEWVRRIRAQMVLGNDRALRFVSREVLGGTRPPKPIMIFFPPHLRKIRYGYQPEEEEKAYITSGGSNEATERIKTELELMKSLQDDKATLGFSATPSGNDLYHWNVHLTNFGHDTPLGQDLTEYALQVDPEAVARDLSDSSDQIKPAEILIEIKFPPNYPHEPPTLRLVRPALLNIGPVLNVGGGLTLLPFVPSGAPNEPQTNQVEPATPVSDTTTTASSPPIPEAGGGTGDGEKLEGREKEEPYDQIMVDVAPVGGAGNWDPKTTLEEVINMVRKALIKAGARVDMTSAISGFGLPTMNAFWRTFKVVSPVTFGRMDIERGGKIILPVSAIEELTQEFDTPTNPFDYEGWRNIASIGASKENTITFEISSPAGRLFCGVMEFTSEPGQVCVPQWIMSALKVYEGDSVQLRRVNLRKGTFVKLQPHEAAFVNLDNPKAMLEWVLPNFVAITAGETLPITHHDCTYLIDVLEVAPGNAISLIDTNLNLELAPPLHGEVGFGLGGEKEGGHAPTSPEKPKEQGTGGQGIGLMEVSSDMKEGVDYKVCDNCMHKISITTYATHSAVCPRINWRCDKCGTVVQKAQRQEHMEAAHTPVVCDVCGEGTESGKLASHKENDCKYRTVQCEFCELKMPYIKKFEHEDKCGGITEPCPDCKQRVRRRDALTHPSVCGQTREHHFGYENRSPNRFFPPSGDLGMRKSPSVFYCHKCSEVSTSFDDLQVHLLTVHHEENSAEEKSEKEEGSVGNGEKPPAAQEGETKNSQESTPPNVQLRKCAWSGCSNTEAEGKPFMICGDCRAVERRVPYCSATCQQQDWEAGHAAICGLPQTDGGATTDTNGTAADVVQMDTKE